MNRSLLLLSILCMMSALNGNALQAAAQDLSRIETFRTQTVWTCQKGTNPEALVIFKVDARGLSFLPDTDRVILIRDAQICGELHVACPFVAPLYRGDGIPGLKNRTYRYLGSQGMSEPAVAFYADHGGMKVSAMRNRDYPEVDSSRSWYFNPGECFIYQAD